MYDNEVHSSPSKSYAKSEVPSVAYAGFSKGEGQGIQKIEINEDENENFPAQNQVCFPTQT